MSLRVEYSYNELQNMGLPPPRFLMACSSQDHSSIEGYVAISLVFPKECQMASQNPKEILQIWIDWSATKRQMEMKMKAASTAGFLEDGKMGKLFEAAQKAAKRYQERIFNVGISIARKLETIYLT